MLTDDPVVFLIQRGKDSLKSAEALVELDLILDGLSRAYYAALHHARALLLTIDIIPKSHKGALTLFSLHFIKTGKIPKEIGVIFSILQKSEMILIMRSGRFMNVMKRKNFWRIPGCFAAWWRML